MLHSNSAHNAGFLESLRPLLRLLAMPMYLVVIAWLYVTLMMAVAEATNTTGTVLGAIFTFLMYGIAPVALVVYLMSTPARRRLIKERELAAQAEARRLAAEAAAAAAAAAAPAASDLPDQRGETPADAVAPVREKP